MRWQALLALSLFTLALVARAAADETLEFTPNPTSPGANHALADMAADTGEATLDFWSAEADFNDDGRLDIMAFAMDSYFCGSGGCSPRLYIAHKKGWQEMTFFGLGWAENWTLLDAKDHGYRRVVYTEGDTEYLFGFTGEYYDDLD